MHARMHACNSSAHLPSFAQNSSSFMPREGNTCVAVSEEGVGASARVGHCVARKREHPAVRKLLSAPAPALRPHPPCSMPPTHLVQLAQVLLNGMLGHGGVRDWVSCPGQDAAQVGPQGGRGHVSAHTWDILGGSSLFCVSLRLREQLRIFTPVPIVEEPARALNREHLLAWRTGHASAAAGAQAQVGSMGSMLPCICTRGHVVLARTHTHAHTTHRAGTSARISAASTHASPACSARASPRAPVAVATVPAGASGDHRLP